MTSEPQEKRQFHEIKLNRVAEIFRKRGFEAMVVGSAANAKEFFLSRIDNSMEIGYGGSRTVTDLGLIEHLRSMGTKLLDRTKSGITGEEKALIERRCFSADVYLASANAVSEEGALVNVDMWSNRTGAIEFGPEKVYLFIGRNKLCSDLPGALTRARQTAAVMNCLRFGKNTPCTKDGTCHDCQSPERICSITSILERCPTKERICLVFINEDLGY